MVQWIASRNACENQFCGFIYGVVEEMYLKLTNVSQVCTDIDNLHRIFNLLFPLSIFFGLKVGTLGW